MELKKRQDELIAQVESKLPEFAKGVKTRQLGILHQDSFAADLDDDEYKLLGMAIKYAGIYGSPLQIIGTNRETLEVQEGKSE
jgi:hypothetical protein